MPVNSPLLSGVLHPLKFTKKRGFHSRRSSGTTALLGQAPQSKIQRLAIGQQRATARAGFRMRQSAFAESESRRPGPVQLVINFFELNAIHKPSLVSHSPTADARRNGCSSCNFSASNARARCKRDLTVPTGQFSADAASS